MTEVRVTNVAVEINNAFFFFVELLVIFKYKKNIPSFAQRCFYGTFISPETKVVT